MIIIDTLPEGAVMVIVEDSKMKVYFADDPEVLTIDRQAPFRMYAEGQIKAEAKRQILKGVIIDGIEYSASIEDQLNIVSASSVNSGARVSSSGGKVKLNPAQVNQLNSDMVAHREKVLDENDLRIAELPAATTETEIQAIIDKVW